LKVGEFNPDRPSSMGRLVNHNAPFPHLDAGVKQAFPKNALADRTGSSEEDDFHLVTSGAHAWVLSSIR
jgi:hypothetical protein